MVSDNSPERLPSGWTIHTDKNGRRIKDGVDCLTGDGDLSESTASEENEVPEWLPDRWIMEVKTQKVGTKMRVIDKCYTPPASGWKFHSKQSVLDFLATTNSSGAEQGDKAASKPDKAQNSEAIDVSRNKSKKKKAFPKLKSSKVISRTPAPADDKLPAGWIKEMRIREYEHYTTKDSYYLDPQSGYMFRSKPDAFQYIKTRDITDCCIKPEKRDINEELPFIFPADGLKPVSTNTRRQPFQETQALLIAENTSVSTPPNDILQEIETPEEKIAKHSKQINTSKKQPTFILRARSSKRFKGLEPEIKRGPLLNEQAIRAAARGSPKQIEEQLGKEKMGSTRPLDNNKADQDGKVN